VKQGFAIPPLGDRVVQDGSYYIFFSFNLMSLFGKVSGLLKMFLSGGTYLKPWGLSQLKRAKSKKNKCRTNEDGHMQMPHESRPK
jgi:hypothetical protein